MPHEVEHAPLAGYRHEAFFYGGHDEFMRGTLDFARDAIAAGEPMLVIVDEPKVDALRRELGADAARVQFTSMTAIGTNPACIIPTWQAFLSAHAHDGVRVRGIGEPISDARDPDEVVECHRHEALLNRAFATLDFWLLCPYDTRALDASVIAEAERNHPFVRRGARSDANPDYAGTAALTGPFGTPLPDPPYEPTVLEFDATTLRDVRRLADSYATLAGLDAARTADLAIAVSEISTNSVQHGGGHGTVHMWLDRGVVCEVRDGGELTGDPMVGRRRPDTGTNGGRGLWLANHLCDLVQLRSFATGTVVRLHMRAA